MVVGHLDVDFVRVRPVGIDFEYAWPDRRQFHHSLLPFNPRFGYCCSEEGRLGAQDIFVDGERSCDFARQNSDGVKIIGPGIGSASRSKAMLLWRTYLNFFLGGEES